MIANLLCYGFWYDVRCELVVVRMNVCDMMVVVVDLVTGGCVKMTVVMLPGLVLLCV